MKDYKKLLIISHNCLSKNGSNGRTLSNYLRGWPKDKIAQLYIHPEQPDFDICEDYFCLTDSSVAKSVIKRTPAGYTVEKPQSAVSEKTAEIKEENIPQKKPHKNSLVYLAREFVWRSNLWNKSKLNRWVENVQPEVILVQAGDAGFLFELALTVSKKFSAPIVVYNTEGYYFKKKSYLPENKISSIFYPVLNCVFKKSYDKLVKGSKAQVYNCDLLGDDYDKLYGNKSFVIMNTSEFTEEEVCLTKKNKIVYAGNLGLLRHKSLIEFANALQKVSPETVVDVYGKVPNENVKAELENCKGIRFNGFIPYEELKGILRESKYLLHIESFEPFYKEDLKYAFSTKIADNLAVGCCLFVYAPENMAVIQYLKGKNAAVLITEQSELEAEIMNALNDINVYENCSQNSRMLAEQNHNIKINKEAFQLLLSED